MPKCIMSMKCTYSSIRDGCSMSICGMSLSVRDEIPNHWNGAMAIETAIPTPPITMVDTLRTTKYLNLGTYL